MSALAIGRLEENTRQISLRIDDIMRRYRPSRHERRQDWLMAQMARDAGLKTGLLRFIDVVSALESDSARTTALFREHFSGRLPRSSSPVRLALAVCRHPAFPAGVLSAMSRKAVSALTGRFIVPPDFDAVSNILSYLEQHGRRATFSLLGDEVLSEFEAEVFKTRYIDLIGFLSARLQSAGRTSAPEISIKLTSLTDNFNPADVNGTLRRVRPRLEEIALHGMKRGIGLTIDAEQYEHREITWRVFSEVFGPGTEFGKWEGAGLTIQSYFKDSEKYLATVLDFAQARRAPMRARLVKGAYWDNEIITARQNHWPAPVFEQKSHTDQAFGKMLEALLRHGGIRVAIAGHSIFDHARAEALRESLGLTPGAIEHQTLFRTAEGVSRALQAMGWVTRDYVPSGELVPGMAYFVRRVMENTSPQGFLMKSRSGRSLDGMLKEDGGVEDPVARPERGFRNHPPKRLFSVDERLAFETALRTTAAQWGREYPVHIAGESVKTRDVKASLSPSQPDPNRPDTPVGRVFMAGVPEAARAIVVVRQGFRRWSQTPARERAVILLKAAARLSDERDTLAAWIVHEGGRTWAEALADVDEAADHFAYNAHRLMECERRVQHDYRPRGVVAVIPPWNFPAALPSAMISGALAAGNAVIFKSAEQTPVTAAHLVETLYTAGIPRDVLIHLAGWGEVAGDYLVGSDGVDMVAFTGSKAAGLAINKKASSVRLTSGLKKTIAEMGGKNAIIVCEDADPDEAVKAILLSAFEHANQKCSACSRVFIHRRVFKRLSERLVRAAASLPVGPAYDPATLVNPLIEPAARERVLTYAEKARTDGKVLVDRLNTGSTNPLQVGPLVVLLELKAGSAIAREEIFGPVLALMQFEDEEEMLAEVNGTAYALTAGIFSRSPATIARLVRNVQAGNVYVNRKITGARVGIEPFGGFKLSGTGPKAGGPDYLFAFLTRRQEEGNGRSVSDSTASPPMPLLAGTVETWSANVDRRTDVLRRAVGLLRRSYRRRLVRSLEGSVETAGRLFDTARQVVESSHEIARPDTTIEIPGQINYLDWQTPRGVGFVAAGLTTPADLLAGMVFGPLLAGNGLVLAPHRRLQPLAAILVDSLHRAGVPHSVLWLAADGGPGTALLLAQDMFHFAVTDMGIEETTLVNERLGETREAQGQTWVKALISMQEAHRPGEPGFIRQFALPKTIAIRTLRHGADLGMPPLPPDRSPR